MPNDNVASPHTLHHLPLTSLRPHPNNANRMSPAMLAKLKTHIERTGNYEPLIVRPHPDEPDAYQLINGHHRAKILQSLNHHTAACLIWNLTDTQTNLLLATINRIEGEDIPARRLALLESLAQTESAESLAALLPEDAATLEQLFTRAPTPTFTPPPDLSNMPEAFTIFLPAAQKVALTQTLRAIDPNPAAAVLKLAGLSVTPPAKADSLTP
jgi:hypothetical protein